MDESWRMCMGMSTAQRHPRLKSMENTFVSLNMAMADHNLDADDFSDVFGGPPRSVLCRKLCGDFTRSASFYKEVFRSPELISSHSMKGGRILPEFRIPGRGKGFYSGIFGSDHDIRWSRERSMSNSKAKSKSNSSSVLSSEELSPLCPMAGDDVGLSSFASKLRPINVPCRWNSTAMKADEEAAKLQGMPAFPSTRSFCNENPCMENENNVGNLMRSSSYYGFSRHATSPEIISLEPHSFRSVKKSADDFEFNSPSSPASSLCQEPEARAGVRSDSMQEEEEEEDDDDDGDEVMSSYVIEINSDLREGSGETVSIDEAIAWAKERCNTQSFGKEHGKEQPIGTEARSNAHESFDWQMDGYETMQSSMEEQKKPTTEEEKERSEEHIKMGALDEDATNKWRFTGLLRMNSDSVAQQRLAHGPSNKPRRKVASEKGLSESQAVSSPTQTATRRCNTITKICCREGLFHPPGCMGCIHLPRCLLQVADDAGNFGTILGSLEQTRSPWSLDSKD